MIKHPINGTAIVKFAKANKLYHSHAVEAGTHKTWLGKDGVYAIEKYLKSLGYKISIHAYDGGEEVVGQAIHPKNGHAVAINYTYERQFNNEPYGSVFVHKTVASKWREKRGLDDDADVEYGT